MSKYVCFRPIGVLCLIACLLAGYSCAPDRKGESDAGPRIASYELRLVLAGDPVSVQGAIDQAGRTIRIVPSGPEWIDNIESATAVFRTEDAVTVSVGDVIQHSAVSVNNFTSDVVYQLTGKDRKSIEYTVILESPQSTGLPVINIVTENGDPVKDKENYIKALVSIFNAGDRESDIRDIPAGIRGRGNTTWEYAKKPYRVKFDEKTSLFGLGEAKNWVLLANYLDPTFITGTVAFEIGRRMGIPFTNHTEHVELFLNGKYCGSYVLTEQVQVNEHRVAIDEERDWLLELDTYFDEDYRFRSALLGLPVNVKSPELGEMPQAESARVMSEIAAAFDEMESLLFSENFPDNEYDERIDIRSVIDYLLVNEIVRNAEIIHPKSVFMYRTADGKFKLGPLWDFDWAFGYNGDGTGFNYFEKDTQLFAPGRDGMSYPGYRFFLRFFDDPRFCAEYKQRWENVQPLLADICGYIESQGARLERSAVENRKVWEYCSASFPDEINRMKEWQKKRMQELDTAIGRF